MENHTITLKIHSPELGESAQQSLTRELAIALRQQGIGNVRLDEADPRPLKKGGAVEIGNIILTLIGSGGVAVTLIQVLRAYVERKSSLHFEILRSDGEKRILTIENLKDAKLSATERMIGEFLKELTMPGERFAILIGNSVYPEDPAHLLPLRCPISDIDALAETLASEQHGGYIVSSVPNATHDVGLRAIYDCLKKATPVDSVLIYYSGHGKLDESGSLYLATKDTVADALPPTAIPADDIRRYMRDSAASVIIVILDCCFSGAVKKMFKSAGAATQAMNAINELKGEGTFYLTASTDIQTAEEKETDQYSLLTKHILDGIREGSADTNDDGVVSFQELCTYVQKKVAGEGRQRPKSWSLEAAGEITVALTGKPAFEHRRKAITKKLYELASEDLLSDGVVSAIIDLLQRLPSVKDRNADTVGQTIDRLYSILRTRGEFLHEVIRLADHLQPGRSSSPKYSTYSKPGDSEYGVVRWLTRSLRFPRRVAAYGRRPLLMIITIVSLSAISLWTRHLYTSRAKERNMTELASDKASAAKGSLDGAGEGKSEITMTDQRLSPPKTKDKGEISKRTPAKPVPTEADRDASLGGHRSSPPPAAGYRVNIAEGSESDCKRMLEELAKIDVVANIYPMTVEGNVSDRFVVRAGPFSETEANALVTKLAQNGYPDASVRRLDFFDRIRGMFK